MKVARVEVHKVKSLVPWNRNPREHSEDQLQRLGESLDHFGVVRYPVIQHRTNRILAGHGLVAALLMRGQGELEIPCIAVEMTVEDAEAYTLADNRLADLSEWNLPQLREVLAELDNGAFPIQVTGWTEDELKKLFGAPLKISDGDQEAPEAPEPKVVVLLVHPHRVEVVPGSDRPTRLESRVLKAAKSALFPKAK